MAAPTLSEPPALGTPSPFVTVRDNAVLREPARGGMGVFCLARDGRLGREAALGSP